MKGNECDCVRQVHCQKREFEDCLVFFCLPYAIQMYKSDVTMLETPTYQPTTDLILVKSEQMACLLEL